MCGLICLYNVESISNLEDTSKYVTQAFITHINQFMSCKQNRGDTGLIGLQTSVCGEAGGGHTIAHHSRHSIFVSHSTVNKSVSKAE